MKTKKILLFLPCILFSFQVSLQAQSLKVDQIKDDTYAIAVNSFSTKSKLHWSTKADSWKNAQPLTLKSGSETVVLESAHPILKLETAANKSFYAAPREIKLEGACNFRDIGGYPTTDGRQVKWGKIYRSADVSKLADADLKVIRALNIKMVCDLRSDEEVEAAPDRLPEGTERIHLPAGSENVSGANSISKYMTTPERADSVLKAFYKRTDHLGKKYKGIFDELLVLETDHALMFHCAAGQDRTGVGAALILYALGVEEASIYQDYEASTEFRKGHNEEAVKMFTSQGLSESDARKMMAAKPERLKAAMDAIAEKYGSIDQFLEKEIGLTADKKAKLQSKFLY